MSFQESAITAVLNLAETLGASHVVFAKLELDEVKTKPHVPLNTTIISSPMLQFGLFENSSGCPASDIMIRSITVRFTVYSVATKTSLIYDEAFTASDSYDRSLARTITANLMARIQLAGDANQAPVNLELTQSGDTGKTAEPPKTYMTVLGASCNIRFEPTTNSRAIAKVKRGEILMRLGKTNVWYHVQLSSGKIGWIHKDLVD